jgi:uncharacterized integral membrane protein (TIGR00697 family)
MYKQSVSPAFLVVTTLFVVALITSNIIAVKLIDIAGQVITAGIIIFPVSYIVGDVLTEVYGFKKARAVIFLGFVANLLVVLAIWVSGLLPSASFWAENQPAYETILGYAPRLLAASFVAYLVGEITNSAVLSHMKTVTGERWLWSRTIGSTVIGQGLDSTIFVVIAFAGQVPELWHLIWIQWVAKVLYEVAATPATYAIVNHLKNYERA